MTKCFWKLWNGLFLEDFLLEPDDWDRIMLSVYDF